MTEHTPRIGTDEKLFVNEATLDYFKLQLESQVRERLFKWIGIPLGGGGLLAIIFAVWFWIPDKVQEFIDSSEVVQEQLEASVESYLNDPERGGALVETYLSSEAGKEALRKGLQTMVTTYFVGEDGQRFVEEQVRAVTGQYFEQDQGRAIITSAVQEQFQSPEVRQIVETAVNEALRPASANLSSHIRANQHRLVAELTPIAVAGIAKESMDKLYRFLQSREAEELRQTGKALGLTLTASGPIHYARFAIQEYVEVLQQELNLQRVVILNPQGDFLAAVRPAPFLSGLDDELVELLNTRDFRDSRQALVALLEARFGAHSLSSLSNTLTIREALIDGPWVNWKQINERVAVVDAGKFVGLTGRDRLIATLLEADI